MSNERDERVVVMLRSEIDWVEDRIDHLANKLSNMSVNHPRRSRILNKLQRFENLLDALWEQLEEYTQGGDIEYDE